MEYLIKSPYFNSKGHEHQAKQLNHRGNQYANSTISKASANTPSTAAQTNAEFEAKEVLNSFQEQLVFPFMNFEAKTPRPLKIWENVVALMEFYKIEAKFDEIKRETIISGLDSKEIDDCVLDII